tara:strand:- start:205 stop:1017 length:813 start_codon:yes stop_codon:yes gene_type:complete
MTTYSEHYKKCQEAYDGPVDNSRYNNLYDLSIDSTLLETDGKYTDLITEVAAKVKNKLDASDGCFLDETQMALRLNEWRDITEIGSLVDYIMRQLEEKVFHSSLQVEFVFPYRNCVIEAEPATSWMWHYDDCPKEFLKCVVYLTDVTADSGCLQYLSNTPVGAPVLDSYRTYPGIANAPKLFPRSRIPPEMVESFLHTGGEIRDLVGPPGTCAVLTPNIMHRATTPKKGATPRDAIFFYIRPTLQKKTNYITTSTNSYLPARNTKEYALD